MLDFTTGGYFRVFHGALDASTVSLRTRCAINIDDAIVEFVDHIGVRIRKNSPVLDSLRP